MPNGPPVLARAGMIDASHLRIFRRFLNLAENDSGSPETDYGAVYVYRDGKNKRRQVTLGRGFTDDGGNLRKVVEGYIARGGSRSAFFRSRLDRFGKGLLADDREFIAALKAAASEPAMQAAQDEVFNDVYLNPALAWAEKHGFREPLSVAVIVDSYLHSGSMLKWLMNEFPEKKPAAGGRERVWIESYCTRRLAWFKRATGALHTCQFRPRFFLTEIARGNWDLKCPLVVPGKGTIC